MGDFVIRIHAVGGHGHHRDVKDGCAVPSRCDNPEYCPDCLANEFVERLKGLSHVKSAVLTHWPIEVEGYSGADQVADNLLNGRRRGQF